MEELSCSSPLDILTAITEVNDMEPATLTIFSGGTAFNSVCRELTESLTPKINHILPVSDNGGSSREIVRVLGGPAIGDIRSRLIRLASETTEEQRPRVEAE